MKAPIVAAVLLLAASPLGATSPCLYPTTVRGTIGCGSSSSCNSTGGIALTYQQIEQNVLNSDALCRWAAALAPGTVTSVGLSAPAGFSVSGSPVAGSGTLALGFATWAAGTALMGPASGADAAPTRRAITLADLAGALAGYNAPTATFATTAGGAPPTGTAGGGLSGTFPSPTVRNDSHSHTEATLPWASSLARGIVQLAQDGVSDSAKATSAADPRLANARTPLGHHGSHNAGQADALSGSFDISITGNAGTSSAFDHSPAACPSGQYASAQAADGALTCSAPAGGGGSGPFADLEITNTGAGQTDFQIHDDAGNGIRLGRGQGGNAVNINGMFMCDRNINGCFIKDNSTLQWGDVNQGAYHGPIIRARHLDGAIKELGVEDMIVINPTATPPDTCDSDHEGALWANSAQHTLCYCDGTSWSKSAGALAGTCP